MSFCKFEEIIAWQKSRTLVLECYEIFRSVKDYSFRNQLLRAVVSVMNNFAEGFERKGEKQFRHFFIHIKRFMRRSSVNALSGTRSEIYFRRPI